MPESRRWFAAAALIVLLDQLTKWAVLDFFAGRLPKMEITGFLNLVLAFNTGAAFSLLAQAPGWQRPLLIVVALAAAVIVSVLIVRNPEKTLFCAGLAGILGGAVGNLIDRLRFGYVVDFLDFHAFGWHWPAFNVADAAISVGAVVLIVDSLVPKKGVLEG